MPFHQNASEQQRQLAAYIEHLKSLCHIERQPVSKTTADLIHYCERNMQDDPLIFPVKENPFKEKKSCIIL